MTSQGYFFLPYSLSLFLCLFHPLLCHLVTIVCSFNIDFMGDCSNSSDVVTSCRLLNTVHATLPSTRLDCRAIQLKLCCVVISWIGLSNWYWYWLKNNKSKVLKRCWSSNIGMKLLIFLYPQWQDILNGYKFKRYYRKGGSWQKHSHKNIHQSAKQNFKILPSGVEPKRLKFRNILGKGDFIESSSVCNQWQNLGTFALSSNLKHENI